MLSPQRLPQPIIRHRGYFSSFRGGLSDIGVLKNSSQPENTLIYPGSMRGKYKTGLNDSVYCIGDGFESELIVTIYEQLSKRGIILYLKENSRIKGVLDDIVSFLASFDENSGKRIFVTFTGGATLSRNILASQVLNIISSVNVINVTWNTWHLLPNKWRCFHTCWVVRLDLNSGNVSSFETSFSELNYFVNQNNFLIKSRLLREQRSKAFIDDWFRRHPQMSSSKSRVTELISDKTSGYCYTFLQPQNDIESYIFVYYPHTMTDFSEERIAQMLDTKEVAFVILYPSNKIVLPKGPEISVGPESVSGFQNEPSTSYTLTHRKVPRPAANTPAVQNRARSTSILPVLHFTITESATFKEQLAILQSIKSGMFQAALAKIESIRQDLQSGRLPEKTVAGYYVSDVTGLGGTGRGAWRLLIERKGNVLNLYCIADYHQNRWRVWS